MSCQDWYRLDVPGRGTVEAPAKREGLSSLRESVWCMPSDRLAGTARFSSLHRTRSSHIKKHSFHWSRPKI